MPSGQTGAPKPSGQVNRMSTAKHTAASLRAMKAVARALEKAGLPVLLAGRVRAPSLPFSLSREGRAKQIAGLGRAAGLQVSPRSS